MTIKTGSFEISIGRSRILFVFILTHLVKRNSVFWIIVESRKDEEVAGSKPIAPAASVDVSRCLAFLEIWSAFSELLSFTDFNLVTSS